MSDAEGKQGEGGEESGNNKGESPDFAHDGGLVDGGGDDVDKKQGG